MAEGNQVVTAKKKSKYSPDYDYSKCCEWSMSKEESDAIFEEAAKLLDSGDEDGYFECVKKIPLAPNMALLMRDDMGKEALLESGFNLKDAEIVYGADWLDNYAIDE